MVEARQADAIVLFGATGDLAKRMLLPSLYYLDADGFLPDGFKVLATARAHLSHGDFVAYVRELLAARPEGLDETVWARFSQRLDFAPADATFTRISVTLSRLRRKTVACVASCSAWIRSRPVHHIP